MAPGPVYSFGPFQLDEAARRLTVGGEPVVLTDRQIDILLLLLSKPGQIISKDSLIDAAWKDVAVGDNSLEQAISSLRRVLATSSEHTPYIETVARRGYRLGVPVTRAVTRETDDALAALLAPHRAFVEGRASLETLDREAIARGRAVFEDIVRASPDYAPAHVALANALALQGEGELIGASDREALTKALHHASEACRLDPSAGEAWATLGLLLHQARDHAQAIAAARRAIALEPDNWRHHLRLGYVSWGEERLRAAGRVLKLLPGLALAHWLVATVHIARQSFAEAEVELRAGTAAQDRQQEGTRFTGVGLHLLLGLVRLAQGDEQSALKEFASELAFEESTHIYAREARTGTWCAVGAVRLRQRDNAGAVEAFDRALTEVPAHAIALAARTALTGQTGLPSSREKLDARLGQLRAHGASLEAAVAEGVYDTLTGRADRAPALVRTALDHPADLRSAWKLPVEPLLFVHASPDRWADVLTLLRSQTA